MNNLLASKEVVDHRLAYCDPCEHNKLGICKKCGCFIQGKTRIANQRCPLSYWGPEQMGLKSLVED
jgi:hypothetical protein